MSETRNTSLGQASTALDHTPAPRTQSASSSGFQAVWWVLILVAAGAAAVWWLSRGSDQSPVLAEPLSVIAAIPDFSLVERDGRRVQRADLMGKVWVANFVFTNCAGPCPELSLRMRSIQQSLTDQRVDADVMLVTFTLDPVNDTPEVLRAYAVKLQAQADRWWFLTGMDEKPMHELVQKGFLQAVQAATKDSPIVHSTYFVLLDRAGRIRAVYDGLEAKSKPLVLRDIQRLLSEPAAP